MKRIIIALFTLLPFIALSQTDGTINKGSGIFYFSGKPVFDPSGFADYGEFAIDVNAKKAYVYSGSGTVWNQLMTVDTITTLADTTTLDRQVGKLAFVTSLNEYYKVNDNANFDRLAQVYVKQDGRAYYTESSVESRLIDEKDYEVFSYTNQDIDSTIINTILQKRRNALLTLFLTDSITQNHFVQLPNPSLYTGKQFFVKADYKKNGHWFKLKRGLKNPVIKANGNIALEFFLPNGEILLIKSDGQHWSIKYSNKPKSINKYDDWKKFLFEPGEKIKYQGLDYEIVTATYLNDSLGYIRNNSFSVIPVQGWFQSPTNLFYNSENFVRRTPRPNGTPNGWRYVAEDFTFERNTRDVISVDGDYTATKVIYGTDSFVKFEQINNDIPFTIENGDTVFVSFYVRTAENDTLTSDLIYRDRENRGFDELMNLSDSLITDEWRLIKFNYIANQGNKTEISPEFFAESSNYQPGDSIYVDKFSYTVGDYKYTNTADIYRNSDTLYAVLPTKPIQIGVNSTQLIIPTPISNSFIYTSSIDGFADDTERLNESIYRCVNSDNCAGVFVDEPLTITDTISIPSFFTLKSLGDKTPITANLNNADLDLFICGDYNESYSNEIRLENLSINAISPANSAIKTFSSLRGHIENVNINGTENKLFDYGIYEYNENFRAIDFELIETNISNCDTAMYFEHQHTASWQNVRAINCNWGFISGPGSSGFTAFGLDIELIENSGIVKNSEGQMIIFDLGGEKNAIAGNNTPVIDVKKASTVKIDGSCCGTMTGSNSNTSYIRIDTVEEATITNNNVILQGPLVWPMTVTDQTQNFVYYNNYFNEGPARPFEIDSVKAKQRFIFLRDEFIVDNLITEKPFMDSSFLLNTSIDRTIRFLSDTAVLIGANNLLARSNDIQQFPFWNNNSNSVNFTAGQIDPEGGNTASKVKWQGGFDSFIYLPQSGGTSYELTPNSYYNLSFYCRLISAGDSSWIYPLISEAELIQGDTAFINTTTYNRYDFTFKTSEKINSSQRITFNVAPQDSFLFAFPQLSEGYYVKDYIETTISGNIESTKVVANGSLEVTGDIYNDKVNYNYTFTPFAYTGLDILPVDTLLSQRFVVTGALDGKTITGVEYTLDNQVTTDSTLVRLLKYTPSTNTYTSFGNASITVGNSFVNNTPSQSIAQGDIIYCETTQTGDNVTGLTVTLKIE